MKRADVVFFKASDNLISKTIAKLTSSDFTHVGLVISDSIDGKSCVIIEADRFIKTGQREFIFDSSRHALFRVPNLTEEQEEAIVKYALSMEGRPYDYLLIFSFLLRLVFKLNTGSLFNRANSLICSELIDNAFHTSGVKRTTDEYVGYVTPQDLLDKYEFHLVNSCITDTQPFLV